MAYLKFDVEVDTWVTSEADPDDSWGRDSTDGSVSVTGCRLSKDHVYDGLPAAFEVSVGDKIWLVWAQYSTGDSFGSDGGCYELCAVFKSEPEAAQEAARLRDVNDYSVPWNGYFEDLDFIKVEEFEVKPC